MPKLLQINLSANWGSHGKIVAQIGDVVISHGWESYIAYGRECNPCSSTLIKVGTKWDIYEHLLETRLFDNHGLASRRATRNLIKKITEISPDIIHLHNIHGYYLNYRILFEFLKMADIPVVWTFHDFWAMTGHCGHFIQASCYKWKNVCGNCPITRTEYPTSLWVDRSKKNLQEKKRLFTAIEDLSIVTVSQWVKCMVDESFFKRSNTRVIYNGLDLDVFKPTPSDLKSQLGISPDKPVVLGVASIWAEHRGLKHFVELSKDDSFQIVLIGITDKQKDALPKNFITIRRTSNQKELAAYYTMADIYLNPTYLETLSMTNIEAQACGTPVVTFRSGGAPETVCNDTGFVVAQGDVDALHESIIQIIKVGKRHYSKKCVNRAKEMFNKEDRYNDYFELYQSLLKKCNNEK